MSQEQPGAAQDAADDSADQSRPRLLLLAIGLTAVVLLKLTLSHLSGRTTTADEGITELDDIVEGA